MTFLFIETLISGVLLVNLIIKANIIINTHLFMYITSEIINLNESKKSKSFYFIKLDY
jgi:hypothetical protein